MKPRLDRLPTICPPAPLALRQPSPTAGARRARRLRQRRKNGVRVLTVEMNGSDLQALAKVAQQADPAVERAIRAVLKAAYGAHGGDREALRESQRARRPDMMRAAVPIVAL